MLGSIILAGAIAFGGCSDKEAPEYKNLVGKVYQLEQQELIYVDNQGFGSSKDIHVPITFLGVEAEGKKYQLILVGPHDLKKGDIVNLDYLTDNEVTGREIWNRYYPKRANSPAITEPNVRFKVDGYATAWEKE